MSLQFKSLPLVEVTLRLIPTDPIPLDIASLWRVTEDLRDRFSDFQPLDRLYIPAGHQSNIKIGQVMGARFSAPSEGISFVIQSQAIWISWENATLHPDVAYPRFKTLVDTLQQALSSVRKAHADKHPNHFNSANVSYTNSISTKTPPTVGNVLEYVNSVAIPCDMGHEDLFIEQNLCWRQRETYPKSEVEFRVQIQAVQSSDYLGFSLTTTAGRLFDPADWPAVDMQLIHDKLETVFVSMMTERAKKEWGFVQ